MKTLQLANAEFLPHVCELVNEGHTVSIRAKGNSMRPFLESERDVIGLAHADSYSERDVVLAEIAKGHYVLHRIERIVAPDGSRNKHNATNPLSKVTLRGDGNVKGTEHCLLKDVRAKAITFDRKGKTWSIESKRWKIYSHIWPSLLPLRRWLLLFYRLLWLHELPQRFTRNKTKQNEKK